MAAPRRKRCCLRGPAAFALILRRSWLATERHSLGGRGIIRERTPSILKVVATQFSPLMQTFCVRPKTTRVESAGEKRRSHCRDIAPIRHRALALYFLCPQK